MFKGHIFRWQYSCLRLLVDGVCCDVVQAVPFLLFFSMVLQVVNSVYLYLYLESRGGSANF